MKKLGKIKKISLLLVANLVASQLALGQVADDGGDFGGSDAGPAVDAGDVNPTDSGDVATNDNSGFGDQGDVGTDSQQGDQQDQGGQSDQGASSDSGQQDSGSQDDQQQDQQGKSDSSSNATDSNKGSAASNAGAGNKSGGANSSSKPNTPPAPNSPSAPSAPAGPQQGGKGSKAGGKTGDVRQDYKDAYQAAEREAGRIVAQQAMAKMQQQDRNAVLNKYRDALRGELLKKYAFDSMFGPKKMYGYVIATREGHDRAGNYCRELEMDIIYNLERHFERNISCFYQDKMWHPTAESDVNFKSSDARPNPGNPSVGNGTSPTSPFPTNPSPVKGGWLPPFKKK